MSAFIQHTVSDLKAGRETWRVIALFSIPSFFTALGFGLMNVR